MADETTPEATEPDAVTEAPTEASSEAPAEAPSETPTEASTEAPAPPADRKGIFVPRWLAIVLGIVLAVALVGGGGFALGRATDDHDSHEGDRGAQVDEPGSTRPNRPDTRTTPGNGGNGSRQGGGNTTPQRPTSRVYLGVLVESATGGTAGARVVRVAPGSPADDAGLQADDVITKFDGTDITDAAALGEAVRAGTAGQAVTITYDRNGASKTAQVELAEGTQPGFPSTSPSTSPPA
jgi:putative serine protease PepD